MAFSAIEALHGQPTANHFVEFESPATVYLIGSQISRESEAAIEALHGQPTANHFFESESPLTV
jgi:hypothetical protein